MDYSVKTPDMGTDPVTTPRPDVLPTDTSYLIYMYMLITSMGIIIILSILEKRTNNCSTKCGNRPGLIYPVNLLDHGCDNIGYSMAFGSVAGTCFALFFIDPNTFGESYPAWSRTLIVMLVVLIYGLVFYPLFACLTTTWVFVGSFLGLGYTAAWLYINIKALVQLAHDSVTPTMDIAMQAPVIFCLLCLFLRYGYIFSLRVVEIIKNRSLGGVIKQHKREHLGTSQNVAYVKDLLVPACNNINISDIEDEVGEATWKQNILSCVKQYVYKNDPNFKYSPRIICIFTVALICAYQFGIILLKIVNVLSKEAHTLYPDNNSTGNTTNTGVDNLYSQIRLLMRVGEGSIVFSFVVSSLITVYNIFQILTNYRRTIKQMYKGRFQELPFKRHESRPYFILSNSLCYSGAQIAYLLWGYIITCVVLAVICVIVMYLIILPILKRVPDIFLNIFLNFLPGFFIYQGLTLIQKITCRALLQSRQTVNEKGETSSVAVLALDNRKIYHNISYFLFFFYIVLGLFSCLVNILKGLILGVLFLGRMDRCGLLSGFETWDRGFMNYVSFLYVEESHRHPVLLVFCDILLEIQHWQQQRNVIPHGSIEAPDNQAEYGNGIGHSATKVSKKRLLARNRWFKAYTLIRNPCIRDKDIGTEFELLEDVNNIHVHLRRNERLEYSLEQMA